MRILSAVPVIYSYSWTKLCLSRITGEVLIIDNDSQEGIKELIEPYKRKIVNKKNVYVNPAWNQAIEYFLKSKFDLLALISSDVAMAHGWELFVSEFFNDQIMIPFTLNIPAEDMKSVSMKPSYKKVPGGHPGTFILLSKQMAKIIYPIPETIKIWFGDEWIFSKLMKAGYEMHVYYNLTCVHGNSRSVETLGAEAYEIIRQDKEAWGKIRL